MTLTQVTGAVNRLFEAINRQITALLPVPAVLLLCSVGKRPGLSALRSLANVTAAFEQLGIPVSPNPDGTDNIIVKASYALLQEVYRAFTEDAVVDTAIRSGSINVLSNGTNAAGEVISNGTNLTDVVARGIIR